MPYESNLCRARPDVYKLSPLPRTMLHLLNHLSNEAHHPTLYNPTLTQGPVRNKISANTASAQAYQMPVADCQCYLSVRALA
jgi:hypothetical protein